MTNIALATPPLYAAKACPAPASKDIYFALADGAPDRGKLALARRHIAEKIDEAREIPVDLPTSAEGLCQWMERSSEAVGKAYRQYLAGRKAGMPRHFFTNKSHALFFLKSVAPTKLVDGAWLYGVLNQWTDPRFHDLILTYLEELGEGVANKNHVVLYQQLLATHGCEQWTALSEPHFVQGAIQLALAYNGQHFLPEIIGYNLGYEQLPLHLLITAYELNELGIDPYYFTLHVTVDNAGTGHARKSVQSLMKLLPQLDDGGDFYRRVVDGYRLNELGANTNSVIASFNLQDELVNILQAKSVVGKNMHSDYCRVAGRTVNEWLSDPAEIPRFLQALESAGWIKRGEAAENSKFWRLIQSERAEMFGVFSVYEQQILRDWIATPGGAAATQADEPAAVRVLSFRARKRSMETEDQLHDGPRRPDSIRGLFRHHRLSQDEDQGHLFNPELRELEHRLAALGNRREMMETLIGLMSPAQHHNSTGLMATRIFGKMFR